MRFEDLLAHQGPLVHVDHSFRRPRQRSAPTEAPESTSFLSRAQKPDLTKTDPEWLDLVGREDGKDNSEARLWGPKVDYENLEPAARYGKANEPAKPVYASKDSKSALADKLVKLNADDETISKVKTFIEYLKWLQWHTYDWRSSKRNDLERAEERSWKALHLLFGEILKYLNAKRATQLAQKAIDDNDKEYKAVEKKIEDNGTRISENMAEETERKNAEYRLAEQAQEHASKLLTKRERESAAAELRKSQAEKEADEARKAKREQRTMWTNADNAFRRLDDPVKALGRERVQLQDENDALIDKKGTITKAKQELQKELAAIKGKESGAKDSWLGLVHKFAFKPEELNS